MGQDVNVPENVVHIFLFGIESYMYEMDFPFAPHPPGREKLFPKQKHCFELMSVCGFDVLYAVGQSMMATTMMMISSSGSGVGV